MKCQKVTSQGQCGNVATAGSHYCSKHTRSDNLITAYRLSDPQLQDSIKHHAKASLTNLSQQVVLLRAMIERRLNMAGEDEASQIVAYNFVAAQLANLTKMTESLVKLSRESGELMERSEVEEFVDKVVQIVSEEVSKLPGHEKVVDNIVSRITEDD